MLGKLICFFKGHKRGKSFRPIGDYSSEHKTFRCPRCGRTTKYKAKSPKGTTAPLDGSPHFQETQA